MISLQTDSPQKFAILKNWKASLRIYLRITALLRPHWKKTTGAILSLAFSTGFALIVPWLLGWVIDTGLQHGQISTLLLATAAWFIRLWPGLSFAGSFQRCRV